MKRGFGNVFIDLLDRAKTATIEDRFGERSELAEFANPATVTQPVNPSQFPSGPSVVNTVGSNTFLLTPASIGIIAVLIKAFGYWGVLVNRSLGLGTTILATVQREQEVDKSIMNAATYLYVCQHNTEDDALYMSKKLGVDKTKIPRVPLQFMIWSPSCGEIAYGRVDFNRQGRPQFLKSEIKKGHLTISPICGKFSGLEYSREVRGYST